MEACLCMEQIDLEVSKWIGETAYHALIEEVYTTPKPGLVDCMTNGAHKDMCLILFEKSAKVLEPYFMEMAMEGMKHKELKTIFRHIRKIGMEAEHAMFDATNGVNTHKGIIFSLGILCACVGYCYCNYKIYGLVELRKVEQSMVRDELLIELEGMKEKKNDISHGESLYRLQKIMGVRGEAINGFSSVMDIGFPVMTEGLSRGEFYEQVKIQVLLSLMEKVEDTNVLSRSDYPTLLWVQNQAKEFLKLGGAYQSNYQEKLIKMDNIFIKKNISPGGCADLLAVTIFLSDILLHEASDNRRLQ